jgi:hypothetical protein
MRGAGRHPPHATASVLYPYVMTKNRGEIMAYAICTFVPLDIKAFRFFSRLILLKRSGREATGVTISKELKHVHRSRFKSNMHLLPNFQIHVLK